MTLALSPAITEADLDAVRALCWGYRDFLLGFGPAERMITETFYPTEKYVALMERLAEEHARPTGIILLARKDGHPVGCGMSHPLSQTQTEIKRVFVNEDARGTGAGRQICTMLIEQARNDGFSTVLLDTSKNLTAARRLYEALGFVARDPYQSVPEIAEDQLAFYEMRL